MKKPTKQNTSDMNKKGGIMGKGVSVGREARA